MNRIFIGLALLTTCIFGTELKATIVSIDDFTSPDQAVFAIGANPGFDEARGASPIEGVRAIRADVTSGFGIQVNLTGDLSAGTLDISTSAGAAGQSTVTWDGRWDGVATSKALNADLLMGGFNDRLQFDVVGSDPGTMGSFATLVMKVTDGSDSVSSSTAVSLDSSGFVDILFSSFSGINFADIAQLDMIVTSPAGSDVVFNSVKAVPVPSNLVAFASLFPVFALGLIVSRRRRNSSISAI